MHRLCPDCNTLMIKFETSKIRCVRCRKTWKHKELESYAKNQQDSAKVEEARLEAKRKLTDGVT